MASSFSRKSSSSASKAKAPKPTFRKAGASGARKASPSGGSASAASRPAPAAASASKPAATYRAPIKAAKPAKPAAVRKVTVPAKSARPIASAATKRPIASAKPAARGSKSVPPKTGAAPTARRVAGVKPPRTAPVTVKATGSASTSSSAAHPKGKAPKSAKSLKVPFRLPSIGRAKPVAPRKLSGAGAGAYSAASSNPVVPAGKAGSPATFASPHPKRARGPFARPLGVIGAALSRLPLPRVSRKLLFAVAGGVLALAVVAVVVINSPLFAASEVVVNGSEHVTQQAAQQLVDIPDGTTLFNVNEGQIADALKANPWVMGVDIEREYPHKLVITPRERSVKAIAYITADAIAWAIGEDGAWIAPLSLSIAVDANGAEVQPASDGTLPEGAQQLSGLDAALAIARRDGALLLTDVPSDVEPTAGEAADSDVVNAGLEYAKGFTPEFVAQIKDLSVASVEAISANLTSGVEVSLGAPEHIAEKERVVTKLLSQESGVTYINVREPGAYTFRSAPV